MIEPTVTKDMQDENQKPDYSFIMNQPGFEPPKPKRRPKGLMFVIIIVALLGVIAVVGILAKRSTNVKQVVTNDQQSAQQAASRYFSNLSGAKYEDAYDMLEPEDKSQALPREVFVDTVGPMLGNMYDYSTCKATKSIAAGKKYIINVLCNYKDSPLQETLAVTTTVSANTVKIVRVQNIDREPQV